MKQPSLLTSTFLIFLTLLTKSPVNSSRNPRLPKSHELVTDELIHMVCPQTRNPHFCQHILNLFKGKPIFPKPLASIIGMAQTHARTTANKIWGLHNGIKDDKSELKLKYHKCWDNYRNAMNQLTEANRFMHSGNIRSVKSYTSVAMAQVQSCHRELARQQHEPANLARDNRKFEDLSSVILAICDKLLPGQRNNEIEV